MTFPNFLEFVIMVGRGVWPNTNDMITMDRGGLKMRIFCQRNTWMRPYHIMQEELDKSSHFHSMSYCATWNCWAEQIFRTLKSDFSNQPTKLLTSIENTWHLSMTHQLCYRISADVDRHWPRADAAGLGIWDSRVELNSALEPIKSHMCISCVDASKFD